MVLVQNSSNDESETKESLFSCFGFGTDFLSDHRHVNVWKICAHTISMFECLSQRHFASLTQYLAIIVVVNLTTQPYKWATRELAQHKICAASRERENRHFEKYV